jgi:hypothetical protein
MRPAPIPDAAIWEGSERRVMAPPSGDPTDPNIAPVEVLIDRVATGIRFSVRCVLEPGDLEKLAAGGHVWVSFCGGWMPPFSVDVTGPEGQ